ncbi:hypothetical protein [Caballeronia sordidicola]|uniref:hypothetical protein n=1 Tax=Caballeronia sordidicola TaxID=196367 RepID=UPI0015C5C9A6|nr:hypothetical protein [Caballeronia sordidicola]
MSSGRDGVILLGLSLLRRDGGCMSERWSVWRVRTLVLRLVHCMVDEVGGR